MPRTTITKTTSQGSYPSAGVNVSFTAADTVNFNQFIMNARELLVARNVGASTRTVTITSFADEMGRTKDITAENILAGEYKVYGPFTKLVGWRQADGMLYFQANHAEVEFAVIDLQP